MTAQPTPARARLATDVRREQLVRAGVRLLAERTPDQLSVEDVARAAGISRGLLYHYFDDKDSFVVAVLRRAGEELREALRVDPSLAPQEQLEAGIDAFIRYAEGHAAGFRAVLSHRVSNPKVAAIIDQARGRDLDAFVAGVAALAGDREAACASPVLRAALHAHMHFMDGAVLRWLEHRDITREDLRKLILLGLEGTLAAAQVVDPTLRLQRRAFSETLGRT